MLKISRISFGLFLLAAASGNAENVSVLFVGNSLTQVNNLPMVFKKLAAASILHVDVEVTSIAPGGAFLSDHWKRGDVVTRLHEQHPNFLILQGQSTEPLSAPKSFAYYAGLFKTEADHIHSTTILFSTWARPNGDPYYKDATSGGSPAEMQTRLNTAYASLAQDIGATLAPVGRSNAVEREPPRGTHKPAAETFAVSQAMEISIRAQHGFLRHVFGFRCVAQHTQRHAIS